MNGTLVRRVGEAPHLRTLRTDKLSAPGVLIRRTANLVTMEGLEPSSLSLKGCYSTIELHSEVGIGLGT
jgi:hypothetical protein